MATGINNTVDADKPTTVEPTDTTQTVTQEDTKSTPTPSAVVEPIRNTTPAPVVDINEDIVDKPVPTATEAIKGGIQSTGEALQDAPIQTQDRLIEEAAQASGEIEQTEQFAQQREDIIAGADEAIAGTQDAIEDLTQQRAVRDAEALTSVKDKEMTKASLIVEEQRLTNKLAEVEAETKIETAKQQATWAFNKLGLGFSSGIINEVQRIATKGATELARVKITGAKLLADTRLEVAKLEQEYSSEINKTIDKYTDLSISNKQNAIKRIADTQNNLLLNNKQKEDAINKAKDSFKTETRKLEDDMRKEQERLADKQIKQTFALEEKLSNEQNQERTSINRQFQDGGWFNLTERQKGIQLAKAGLGLEEGNAMENTMFSKTITAEVDDALGNNVTITGADRKNIQNLSTSYMEGGLVFAEATKRATLDYISNTPRLKRVQEVQDAILKAKLAPKSSGSKSTKNLQVKIDKEGRFIYFDPETKTSRVIPDEEGRATLSQTKPSIAEEIISANAALDNL